MNLLVTCFGAGSMMEESMRLKWSILNSGFINGMQAVMMLRFIEALRRISSKQGSVSMATYCPHMVGSTLNPGFIACQQATRLYRQRLTCFVLVVEVVFLAV